MPWFLIIMRWYLIIVVLCGLQLDSEEEEDAERRTGNKEERTCFEEVIKCIEEDLKTRIIGRDYDDVALVLFNTVRHCILCTRSLAMYSSA